MKIVLLLGVPICYCVLGLAAPATSPQLVPRRRDTTLDVREFDSPFSQPFPLKVRMFDDNLNIRDIDIIEDHLYPREPRNSRGRFAGQQSRYQNRNQPTQSRKPQIQPPSFQELSKRPGAQSRAERRAVRKNSNQSLRLSNSLSGGSSTPPSEAQPFANHIQPPSFQELSKRPGAQSRAERRAALKNSKANFNQLPFANSESTSEEPHAAIQPPSFQEPSKRPDVQSGAGMSGVSYDGSAESSAAPDAPPPGPKSRLSMLKGHAAKAAKWFAGNYQPVLDGVQTAASVVQTTRSLLPSSFSGGSGNPDQY